MLQAYLEIPNKFNKISNHNQLFHKLLFIIIEVATTLIHYFNRNKVNNNNHNLKYLETIIIITMEINLIPVIVHSKESKTNTLIIKEDNLHLCFLVLVNNNRVTEVIVI